MMAEEQPRVGTGHERAEGQPVVIPIAQEELSVAKRARETGRTVVHVVPIQQIHHLETSLSEEHVEVERVPVNQFIERPTPVRQEGDVTIVPVFEEVLVVEKRLRLKEEIRISRRQSVQKEERDVVVRGEEARIRRVEEPDRQIQKQ